MREKPVGIGAAPGPAPGSSSIHRRVLVAVDRVQEISGLGAGDAALRLRDGTELRLSRNYRSRLGALTSGAP